MAMRSRSTKRPLSRPVPPALHELESEVMEQLWSSGEASVRSGMEALNARTKADRAYTTYMTVMARLHDKGLLARRRVGKTDYYTPVYERDEYMALRAQAEVEGLVAQYGGGALSHFWQPMAGLHPA